MRFPVLLIVLTYTVLILTDLVIIFDLRKMSLYKRFQPEDKKPGKWWIVYGVFSALVLALLTVAVCMPRKSAMTSIQPTLWMLYTVSSVLTAQIFYVIFSLIGFIPKLFRRRRWNTGLWVGLPLGVLVFSAMWWGVFVGRYRIQVVDVEISSPKVPEGFDGYKIAQISDLHVGTWGADSTFLSHLVDKINGLHPDLIVFTGDIVNRESSELAPFVSVLSRLNAPDGVLTVLGNHDYGDYIRWKSPEDKSANLQRLKDMERSMGWKLLDNESMRLVSDNGDEIVLIGVGNWGEPPFSTYGDLSAAYPVKSQRDGNFKILLSHNPEHWNREVSKLTNIDLTLSGHTHAMQFMFKLGDWRWSPSQYKYPQWAGLYTRENDYGEETRVYVNIGAGEVGIPTRIGADPEITLFTLRRD